MSEKEAGIKRKGKTMTDVKTAAISIIEKMPNDSTYEDIMEVLYFKSQVDEGLEQLEKGEYISHEEVKQRESKFN